LFWRSYRVPLTQQVKVYPNYAPVMRLSLLATEHRQDQMGIVRRARGGSSRDFHQLRDYRQGDSLSQIDWKSTSRRLQLISRDYQEQRNQQIVFLLDSGRRMRSLDGDVPHFDHCLNALLMLSYVALRQARPGEARQILTAGEEPRVPRNTAEADRILVVHFTAHFLLTPRVLLGWRDARKPAGRRQIAGIGHPQRRKHMAGVILCQSLTADPFYQLAEQNKAQVTVDVPHTGERIRGRCEELLLRLFRRGRLFVQGAPCRHARRV
jgi:hypothetical protein